MANKISINPDETVSLSDKAGLTGVMAVSCVKQVNALDRQELIAVLWAVKASPFPLGAGEQVYRSALKAVRKEDKERPIAPQVSLGQIRQGIAQRASIGCNAPNDSYLRIAFEIKTGAKVRAY